MTKILVVEDETIISLDIEQRLKSLGYEDSQAVPSGREALDLIPEILPDLILMDIVLGEGMDGVETAGIINERFNIPVVFLTAHSDESTLERVKMTNPFGYILKPFKARELYSTIEIALYRHRLEEMLRESEERFRTGFEHAAIGKGMTEPGGKFLKVNPAFCRMLGYTDEELLEKTLEEVTNKEDLAGIAENIRELIEGDIPSARSVHRLRHKDGHRVWVDLTVALVRKGDGDPLYMISDIVDVTEQKKMEEEAVRTQQLRAVGELASGVSHNLNNILTGVLLPAQLIRRSTDDPGIAEWADYITNSAQRAQDVVKRLNQSISGLKEEVEAVDVNAVVMEAIEMARPKWKDESQARGIEISIMTELEEGPPVKGTQGGILNVLLNLLFNAIDAMPEGGSITFRTKTAGDEVYISLADTGIGMDEEVRQRAFEPFFTTQKTVDVGLGLSVAYGTVVHWGGDIEVESAPGEGAVFTVRLPIWQDEPSGEEPGKQQVEESRRLLLVEDDEIIQETLSRILAEDYEVEVRENGQEAVEQFVAKKFDVVLIDLGLPSMPGDRVARMIREADPAVSTVLITGWVLEEDDPRLEAFDLYVQKPLKMESIGDVVTRAIALHDSRVD
ncbi:MAG: response regulator [Gemmatimonadetes bacterium]|nr:response regulator [Gemmatimonadota bacterium]